MPFLSTGGRGRTSSRCPGGRASRSQRSRKGGHSRGGTLAAAGRQTIVPMATTVTRSARSSRSARGARRRRMSSRRKHARNAVRVVRVRRGLRGGGGAPSPDSVVSNLAPRNFLRTRKSVSSLAMNAASRFDASLRAACSCAPKLAPRPGCRARRRAWFSRGRTRKARSPTTTSGWMTSRTRLAPGTPRARRRPGSFPSSPSGTPRESRGAAGSRDGDAATFAESAAVTGALDAPGIPRTRLETPDGGATGDASATTRHPPSRPPSSRRRCQAATVARRRDARRRAWTRARARETPEDRERGVELSRRKHVAGKELGATFLESAGTALQETSMSVQDISGDRARNLWELAATGTQPWRRVPNSQRGYRGTCTRSTRGGSRPSRRPPERERERRTVR